MFHLSLRPLRPLSNGKQSPTYWIQYLHVRTMRQSWALTSRLTWLVRTGPDVSIPNLYANELGIDRWLGPWRACTWFWRIDFFLLAIFAQRLDIRGRIKVLHGQNRKTEEPPLALFAICTPFGPPSLLELPHKESMFKSKHRLDLALVSMDQRWLDPHSSFACPFTLKKTR